MQSVTHISRWFRNPLFLLAAIAALTACVVQSGELGSSDTQHRLQAAQSFWTSEPAVFPNEYPEFGIHGRDGKLYGWYGIGQSLVMLPAVVIGTYAQRMSIFSDYAGNDPTVRNIIVAYSTSTLICVLSILICFRFLRGLAFTVNQAAVGALTLLFATTFLHYTQNLMENNLILLFTLAGFCFQYEWLRTGSKRALLIGSAALGANLMVRLTTALDIIAAGTFVFLLLWTERKRGAALLAQLWTYVRTALPFYAAGLLVDRLYQFARFGSFWSTYISLFGQEQRSLDPTLPANFPWSTPWREGFLGPLISPEKSIFLFDPLLILSLLLAIFLWRRLAPEIKAYLAVTAGLLAMYILFYAKFFDWSGDFAWGDRYVSTAAQLVAFISVPLLLRHRAAMGKFLWVMGIALLAASVTIQISSILFWCPLEIYQMDTLGHPTFVIALRFKNTAAFLLGKMEAWGLTNESMTEDPWDYAHITNFNFLPFVLHRMGQAPSWAVAIVAALWTATLASLTALLGLFFKQSRACKFDRWPRQNVDRT
jgi:hypothetical protein